MNNIKIIFIAAVTLFVYGCANLIEYYDVDHDAFAFKNQSLLEYFESRADTTCSLYCEAVRLAGIQDEVLAGNRTCIIPNNVAFTTYLSQAGVENVSDIPAPVWKDLLLYMIFPGDFRVTEMVPGENYEQKSLRGDEIFIGRNENALTYRVLINSVYGMESITVKQQDYLFKDNTVGQVVDVMPLYKKSLRGISDKPADYEPGLVKIQKLEVSDDSYISAYGTGKTTIYDNTSNGIRLYNRGGYYCYGFMRFPLDDCDFVEDIVSAKLALTIFKMGASYPEGTECKVSVGEVNPKIWGPEHWTEADLTWNSTVVDKLDGAHAQLGPVMAGEETFLSPGLSAESLITVDITPSILDRYEGGDTFVDYVLSNQSATTGSGAEIYFKDKDSRGFTSYILLTGPSLSPLSVRYSKPLVAAVDVPAVFDEQTLMIDPPVDPGRLDFSPNNVILQLAEPPTKGTLTLYGVPVRKNAKFTQLEMMSGYVKYIRTEAGNDEFGIKVLDYLDGMIDDIVKIIVN